MPFLTAGYPTLSHLAPLIGAVERGGASAVEIGFPFSDPIADGPVIAASMHEALQLGTTPADVFETVRTVRPQTDLGLLAMVSVSIVNRMGAASFVAEAARSGLDGLIVPDLDVEDSDELVRLVDEHGLALALLVAPTTSPERLRKIVSQCRGFVYVLARAGVTGEQNIAPDVAGRLDTIRAETDLPLAVGFGISTRQHVHAATESADAAIVGSALVRRIGEADDPVAEAERMTRELASGLRGGSPEPAQST